MRVASIVRYPVLLKTDFGTIKLNAYFGNKMVGDGITQVSDKEWESAYKLNHEFLDRCQRRGSITWSSLHVEKNDGENKTSSKKANKKAKEQEEVKQEIVEDAVKEETVSEEDALAKADALIEG